MYVDESGDTIALSQNGKRFLVLTGCIVKAERKNEIENGLRSIKEKYYQNPDIEIKSNFLRYANPDLSQNSPLKLHERKKYDELEEEMAKFLKEAPVKIVSSVIDKKGFWDKYPSKNPYSSAYAFLIGQFQSFLEKEDSIGIVIIDPREGQVEKHYIGTEIDEVHHELRFNGYKSNCCKRVIERVLFSTSDLNIGIQLADLYCYPIFHIFEYNKKKEEYWRFCEVTLPKMDYKKNESQKDALLVFPEESKKDLRFFKT